ncbi:MAG: hypothetical protein M3235_09995, partial [Actinomycetota bacterium]|nr:hypothetical protein [Actinomycetota bacterium]
MQDGPENRPRRSRRTRTDDAPPVNGEVANGSDDVLDRYGLRDASTARDDGSGPRRDADDPPPWPPRSRRTATS